MSLTMHNKNSISDGLFYVTKKSYKPGAGREQSGKPSQTIPGESYTMRELVQRHLAGMEAKKPDHPYFDAEDIETINEYYAPGSIDLVDLDNLKRHVNQLNSTVDKALKREKEQKRLQAEKDQGQLDLGEPEPEKTEE